MPDFFKSSDNLPGQPKPSSQPLRHGGNNLEDGFNTVLARLPDAKQRGSQWSARCPAHDDKNASLSLKRAENGSPLIHCFAGCSTESVLAVLGLSWRDVLPTNASESSPASKSPATLQRLAKEKRVASQANSAVSININAPEELAALGCTLAAYAQAKRLPERFLRELGISEQSYQGTKALRISYRDSSGMETAVRYRTALNKGSAGADLRFKWKKGAKLSLYGLWRLPNATESKFILIVEGESDSHTLWHHGYTAVGLPGASNWREERDAAHLAQFETTYVVREPDKGGASLCEALAKSSLAQRVQVVTLGEFKDVSELHQNDEARFKERLEAALAASVPLSESLALKRKLDRDAAWSRCKDLATQQDILGELVADLQKCGLVGEEKNAKILYLALTSRLLPRIVSVIIKGGSSTGKSFVADQVLKFFPKSAYYSMTASSDKALIYSNESFERRMIIIFEAAALDSSDFAVYLMRSLLSEGKIAYDTVVDSPDGPVGRRIEKSGPTGLLTTTTSVAIHPENETRLISLNSDESPEQTRLVMLAIANPAEPPDLTRWHLLQEWIELGRSAVDIPFAKDLASLIPPVAHRLRRDFKALLSLISANALLHQASRKQSADGKFVATIGEDYAVVRELVHDLFAEGVTSTVSPKIRSTVYAVRNAIDEGRDDVSLSVLETKLGLDKGTVSRRVTDAKKSGYLRDLNEGIRGKPSRIVLGDPLPEDKEILPTVEHLNSAASGAQATTQGETPTSQASHRVAPAGTSRPTLGSATVDAEFSTEELESMADKAEEHS